MVNLQLTNKEWYFLHQQVLNSLKDDPDNYIANSIFNKIIENLPKIDDIKIEFQQEYIKGRRLTDKESSYILMQDNNFNQEEFEEAIKPFINNSQ